MQKDSTKLSGNILHTKLMPPRLHAGLVQRAELLEQLDEGLSRRLILVDAPTGYGKSTLVSMWLSARGLPSAWLALDENDNDPVRFWTYAITALRSLRSLDTALGKTALAELGAAQPGALQAALTPLINDLSRLEKDCVLVLEDYQAISAPQVNASLAFLLQHLPATLHVALISRGEPDLPLGILRARGELLELNAAQLRFTRAETEAFLKQALHGELPAAAVARLQERTEGWVAGLRLMALSLQTRGDLANAEQFIQSFSGGHHYVADYLIREVFENQPEAVRTFLLKTCFLERLTGALCDALLETRDGEALLERLERENLFIVQLEHGGGRAWYRYNPLFAESIQYLARQRLGTAGIAALYEKASAWYEVQQLYPEAIEAALHAGQYERAVTLIENVERYERAIALIEKFIELHNLTEMRTLGHWLEAIPNELVLSRPEVCLIYAQVILYSSDRYAAATAQRIEPYLYAAEKAWKEAGDPGKIGEVDCLRGMITLWQGDFQKAFDYNRRALERLPEHDIFWRGVSLLNAGFEELFEGRIWSAQDRILEARALLGATRNIHGVLAADQMLAEIFYWQGDGEQAARLNQQIIEQAVGGEEMLDDQGTARLALADVAYEQNDLAQAEARAHEALDLAARRANESLQAQAAVRLALVQAALGEPDQAQAGLMSFAAHLQNPALLRDVQTAQARLAIRAGDLEALAGWLAVIESDRHALRMQKEREALTLARLRIAQGNPPAALALLRDWQKDAQQNGRVRSQVEGLALEALAYFTAGDLAKATQALSQALGIAHPKGLRRLLLDEGQPMAALIQAALPGITRRPLAVYAAALLHLFPLHGPAPQAAGSGRVGLIEPLSGQELRVLRLLVAGLSNLEISRELVVSTNTVKTHIKNIYRKLDINSREEARQAARELNLV